MPGVMLALVAALNAGVNWTNISAHLSGENNDQVMPSNMTLTATMTPNNGVSQIYYVKNDGAPVTYSGAFAVLAGDTLRWGAQTKSTDSFTVTVSKSGPVTLDTFQVSLT